MPWMINYVGVTRGPIMEITWSNPVKQTYALRVTLERIGTWLDIDNLLVKGYEVNGRGWLVSKTAVPKLGIADSRGGCR
jgi:hypothetical protein